MPPQEKPLSSGLVCPLCKKLFKDAVLITCCGTSYCNECITNELFDSGSRKCPNCGAAVEKYESAIIENSAMRRAVTDWQRSDSSANSTASAANTTISPDVNRDRSSEITESEKVGLLLWLKCLRL